MLLVDKILESDDISREDYEELFKISRKAKRKNQVLTEFFNKCTMSRILDLFLDNPDRAMFTPDFLRKSDISQRSFYNNMKILMSMNMIIEIEIGKKKFYKLNPDNLQVKHISKLRDILDSKYKNVSTTTE